MHCERGRENEREEVVTKLLDRKLESFKRTKAERSGVMDSTDSFNLVSIQEAVIDGGVTVITPTSSFRAREKRRSENTT